MVCRLPTGPTPTSAPGAGVEPTLAGSKPAVLPLDDPGIADHLQKRKERELNPQGSSLGRFRDGCRRQSACPSVQAAAAGIEPAIVSLTGSRLTIGPHRKKSGRWDLNPRFPVPEIGGFPGFPTS